MALIEKEWLEDLLLAHEQNARSIQASGRKVSFTYADGIRTAYADVGLCPSVDAVVVLRCKDCKYYREGLCDRWKYSHVTNEDSFCSGRKGEPMSDLIDRQAAIDVVRWWYKNIYGEDAEKWICESIENLPSAQPERKKGKWKLNKDGNWACPFCEFDPYHDNMKRMNFCPNCGAEMKGEEE